MYRAFQIDSVPQTGCKTAVSKARDAYEAESKQFARGILELLQNDTINAKDVMKACFPTRPYDIFISHSHQDNQEALSLAAGLKDVFGLESFIDSAVWEYGDALLQCIDDEYARIPDTSSYSYWKRNGSTSHVHMMLATSIANAIDQSECVFLLNTPNVIQIEESVKHTRSPWIFYEIETVRIINKRPPQRTSEYSFEEKRADLVMRYPASIENFATLNVNTYKIWEQSRRSYPTVHPLDALYKLMPIVNTVNS